MDALIKTIKLILIIINLHLKGLEKNTRDLGAKNRTLFDVFNKVLALQMKVCHYGMSK
jgi:hypothetical protein